MLNTLEISNFKAFTEKVSIRIRPITLFIGRNNTGKSSAIEFLRQKNPGRKLLPIPAARGSGQFHRRCRRATRRRSPYRSTSNRRH